MPNMWSFFQHKKVHFFKNWIAMTLQTGGIWQTICGLLVAVSQSKIADDPLAPTNLARQ